MSRLIDVEAKIAWAEQHIQKAEVEIAAFLKLKPYRPCTQLEADTGDKVFRIRQVEPVPKSLPFLVGDALHNISGSLDHLAWRLVEACGGTPSRSTVFPISESKTRYEAVANGNRIHGINGEAVRILDAIQPYRGGNDLFWMLREAHNCDKHRHPLGAGIVRGQMRFAKKGGASRFASKWIDPEIPMEDGQEVGRLLAPLDGSDDMDIEIAYQISFIQPLALRGKPVVAFLRQLLSLTNQTVDQFRPLLV